MELCKCDDNYIKEEDEQFSIDRNELEVSIDVNSYSSNYYQANTSTMINFCPFCGREL